MQTFYKLWSSHSIYNVLQHLECKSRHLITLVIDFIHIGLLCIVGVEMYFYTTLERLYTRRAFFNRTGFLDFDLIMLECEVSSRCSSSSQFLACQFPNNCFHTSRYHRDRVFVFGPWIAGVGNLYTKTYFRALNKISCSRWWPLSGSEMGEEGLRWIAPRCRNDSFSRGKSLILKTQSGLPFERIGISLLEEFSVTPEGELQWLSLSLDNS